MNPGWYWSGQTCGSPPTQIGHRPQPPTNGTVTRSPGRQVRTSAPTASHRKNYEIAAAEFAEVLEQAGGEGQMGFPAVPEAAFLDDLRAKGQDILGTIRKEEAISDDTKKKLIAFLDNFSKVFA